MLNIEDFLFLNRQGLFNIFLKIELNVGCQIKVTGFFKRKAHMIYLLILWYLTTVSLNFKTHQKGKWHNNYVARLLTISISSVTYYVCTSSSRNIISQIHGNEPKWKLPQRKKIINRVCRLHIPIKFLQSTKLYNIFSPPKQ